MYSELTLDNGKRNWPKYIYFHSHFQNKFEKIVHIVGFVTRKFEDGYRNKPKHVGVLFMHKLVQEF
jgi:hypothetical protein